MINFLSNFKIILNRFFLVFFILIASPVYAGRYYGDITEVELMALPPFCRSWAHNEAKKLKIEMKRYGFNNPQHLCPGLNALNDAKKKVRQKNARGYALDVAVGELGYVLNARKNKFRLRPTVLRYQGQAFKMQGELSKAIANFEEAVTLKPDYAQAYIELIDVYLKMGKNDTAWEWLEKGLKKNPQSVSLKRKKTQLEKLK